MTVNPRVNPKKLRPYDEPPKRRRTLIPSAPDSSAIGFIVVAALWLALSGALGLLALGLRFIPFEFSFGLGIFNLAFEIDARRVDYAFVNAAVYGWLSNAGFAAICFMAPRLTGRRLALEPFVFLGLLAWNSALLGRHRLALLPGPRPARPADRDALALRRRPGRRRVHRDAVARPDLAQLADELVRQPLVRRHRRTLAARPAVGQRPDRRDRLDHRPRRCDRGPRVRRHPARHDDPVAARDGLRGSPLRRPASRPPATRVSRRGDPDVPHLAGAGARIGAGRPRRRQRAVPHHVARRRRDDRPLRSGRPGVRQPGDDDVGALVGAVRHRCGRACRRLARVPARDEPARGDRRARRRQPLPRPNRLGDRGVHLVRIRRCSRSRPSRSPIMPCRGCSSERGWRACHRRRSCG